jgi:hypothetical protein
MTTAPNRRFFLQAAAVSVGAAALAKPIRSLAGDPVASNAVAAARAGLARAGDRVKLRDVVGVADFSRPSSQPRLQLVDLQTGQIDGLLVAHGKGSDPTHTGWLRLFSNAPGSDATSEGDFVTGDYYVGEHGRSMRLLGLDASNCNAEARGIVVHSAWYVGPEMLRAHGMLGRSDGCFAVSAADLPRVLDRLPPGSLIVSARL